MVFITAACAGTHGHRQGLRTIGGPDCGGASIPWDDKALDDAARIVESSLPGEFPSNPLAIGTLPQDLGDGTSFVLIVPDRVRPPDLRGVHRAAAVPAPSTELEQWYWKIEIGERHAAGAVFVREQGTVFPDGRISRTVSIACGAVVDGKARVSQLSGFGN